MGRDLVYDAILAEIEQLGGTVDSVRPAKGGHRMIYWTTAEGRKIASTAQAYSGNWRTLKHALSNIRRQNRVNGVNNN